MKISNSVGAGLIAASLCSVGCDRATITEKSSVAADPIYQAQYTEDGQLIRPDDWREWVFVGMPVTPNGLNGGKAILPEAQAVYIDPASWRHWKESGTFRDGTMFAVELTLLAHEGALEDGSTTQVIGRGFFQDDFSGLMFSTKDAQRFPDEPGHWAYFSTKIGATEGEYPDTLVALPTEACNSCHQSNGEQDWVFSQFYPVLRAAKPR